MEVILFPHLLSPGARPQFRACELCTFGDRSLPGGFICSRSNEPVALARSDTGACGIHARFLQTDFPLQ